MWVSFLEGDVSFGGDCFLLFFCWREFLLCFALLSVFGSKKHQSLLFVHCLAVEFLF